MQLITCPEEYVPNPYKSSIFMAGGITGCHDWQNEVINRVRNSPLYDDWVLLNPRRSTFDTSRKEDSAFQIEWEYRHIRKADVIYFWFPKEGKCMITLYELGEALGSNRTVRVGCHPEYERAFDVHHQVRLSNPGVYIYSSLDDLYVT